MIFRCQNGRLLNTDHVVEWDKQTEESDDNEERHTRSPQKLSSPHLSRFLRAHKMNARLA